VVSSALVKPRQPQAKDPDVDYEVMSDEEWEEEPEGEELDCADVEEEEEDKDCDEDDGFMVAGVPPSPLCPRATSALQHCLARVSIRFFQGAAVLGWAVTVGSAGRLFTCAEL
jgi:hypothetical protein